MFACRRRSSMNCCGNSATLVLQLHDGDASAALLGRRGREPRDQRMLLQKPGQRALELTGTVAVDESHDAAIGQERLVEKSFGARNGLVDRAADDVEITRQSRAARWSARLAA